MTDVREPALLTIFAPVSGDVVPIENVDDPVFAQTMVGNGLAINPETATVVAPVSGTLTNVFPTGHAVGITTPEGMEVLVHVGLDTVELKGEGFQRLVTEGGTVKVGDPLLQLDLKTLRNKARSLVTPVIVTNMDKVEHMEKTAKNRVTAASDWLVRVQLRP